jgi:hypothetical protein
MRRTRGQYYQIAALARWSMGIAYVVLGLTLAVMWVLAQIEAYNVLVVRHRWHE